VQEQIDLPGSIRTREDYVALLSGLHDLHGPLEHRLAEAWWRPRWEEIAVDLADHRRAHMLVSDLALLGAAPSGRRGSVPRLTTFGQALGCLYVLEGSSLGGRMVLPAITAAIGEVPSGFFSGAGRRHPACWRAVQKALGRYEDAGGDPGQVLFGACETFAAFGRRLSHPVPAQGVAG